MSAALTSSWLRAVPVALGIAGVGGALLMAGLRGSFLPLHLVILGISGACIAGGLLWLREARLRETLSSLVYTVFFVTCVALLYLISANRAVRFDLTQNQVHSLSPQTGAIMQALPPSERLVATVFAPGREHPLMDRFLAGYARMSPQFSYELFDARRDLDKVTEFGGAVDDNAVYLRLLDSDGLVVRRSPPERVSIGNALRENVMTNAIARLISGTDKAYYYIVGHGERRVDKTPDSLSAVVRLVTEAALDVEPLRLAEGRVPENAAALILANPANDLADFEKELLIDYLENGGKLMLMLDPVYGQGEALVNVQAVLARIGLTMPNRYIVDPGAINTQSSNFTPQANFAEHPIADGTKRVPFHMMDARPVESLEEPVEGVRLRGVLHTAPTAWSEPAAELRSITRLQAPRDPADISIQLLGVTASLKTPGGRWGEEMRMMVVGDTDAFTDRVMVQNGDAGLFFLQSLNWLREQENLLVIPPRMLSSTPITLNTARVWMMLGGFLFLGLLITVGGTTRALLRRRMG